MFGLFKLIFSRNYWRLILRGNTWREAGVSVRRLHKDRRARKQLWQTVILLLAPFLLLFYLLWMLGMSAASGGPVFGVIVVLIIVGVRALRRWRSENQETVRLFEKPAQEPPREWTIAPELRKRFAELALVHAVMIDRAGSELFLKTKTLPEQITVITRQVHRDLLQKFGLWEKLAAVDRDLLLRGDGHWEVAEANTASNSLEELRVLRWALRLDDFLPVVGMTMDSSFEIAKDTIAQAEALFESTGFVTRKWTETARKAANIYFQRCAAEGVHRGYFSPESEENMERSRKWALEMSRKEDEDLLLGGKIVAEAEEQVIRRATLLSLWRFRLLDWIMRVADGEVEPIAGLGLKYE